MEKVDKSGSWHDLGAMVPKHEQAPESPERFMRTDCDSHLQSSVGLSGAKECAFLTSHCVMLILLIQEPQNTYS